MATHTHTHRLMALFPGLPRWACTRKEKPIWILLKQETVSDSGISWAISTSAPRSRQITMPAPHHSVFFTGWIPFLPPNQQRQSTEGNTGPEKSRGPVYKLSYDLSQDYRKFIIWSVTYNVLRFLLGMSSANLRTLSQTILQFCKWSVSEKNLASIVRCCVN